ncbi:MULTISPECIES: response regulator [unclassified Duganella]|uniref:response regulator n=1 Tax=unclassified Duganella TaxID=2636909 RepID=UPI000E355028|nr:MULTISPECIES: response regulator [unclassified Duganella]RFP14693.1 response regulator [Duganella sp. BJB475]RFP31041.1 response regulator [Duganella sp. BJB476]
MKILLIEDDLDLGNGVRIALTEQGMEVVWVRTLDDARRSLERDGCDLVLLDLGLPDGDGLTLLGQLRRNKVQGDSSGSLPVLILSARDTLDDRLAGLDGGADDYLVKPFVLAELLSRVRALARRSYGYDGETIDVRGLVLHAPTRRVSVAGRTVELTASEYSLLKMLMMRTDRVLTRRVLEEQTLPGSQTNASNTLDVHMANLRRKIGEGYIRTVRGIGYVIDQQAPGGAA